jgi:hypothetical protein
MEVDEKRFKGKFLPLDLSGQKFGLLTVVDVSHKKDGNYYWNCLCECGKTSIAKATSLRQGNVKSCGHLQGNKGVARTHGMRYERIYMTWKNMKIRCTNPKAQNYPMYGGRGITVCDRWTESFENFYDDMKEGYDNTLSLERINVNGNYCKENCKWATQDEQAANKTNTAYLTYKGVTKRARDWAGLIGVNKKSVVRRIYLGWKPEECLFGKNYEQIKKLILAESLAESIVDENVVSNK